MLFLGIFKEIFMYKKIRLRASLNKEIFKINNPYLFKNGWKIGITIPLLFLFTS